MPIYEYACSKCGSEFEMLVKSSSEKVNCPNCSDSKVKRKLSVFSASVSLGSKSPCSMVESCPSAKGSCCAGACSHKHG
ncbi:MAG: zinc ribbon domain-containing protein [Victivallales bacterium]